MLEKRNLFSIDVLRGLAIFAVVIIHVNPFYYAFESPISVPFIISYFFQQYCRFAIPFFFVVSGYFFGRALNKGIALKGIRGLYYFVVRARRRQKVITKYMLGVWLWCRGGKKRLLYY